MITETSSGKFYDLWFIVDGTRLTDKKDADFKWAPTGSIFSAYCICPGGQDGACKHIAAAMYSLHYCMYPEDKVPTEELCYWKKRETKTTCPMPVTDVKNFLESETEQKSHEEFLSGLKLSSVERKEIESSTRGQGESEAVKVANREIAAANSCSALDNSVQEQSNQNNVNLVQQNSNKVMKGVGGVANRLTPPIIVDFDLPLAINVTKWVTSKAGVTKLQDGWLPKTGARETNGVREGDESRLRSLLSQYQDVFTEQKGVIKGFEADIRVPTDTKHVFRKPYPVPYPKRDQVTEQLLSREDKGVYRKVESSTWASPMVTVVKESGDFRLCGDYKVTVNQFLEADPYPLPSTEELLSTIGPAKYFSKIDLANAFQQLKLSDGSKELLTVNTPIGLLQYERMPFGIKTAPQIFQRAMDEILNGIKGVVCYIDNILISSTDKERQYQILAEVLKRLEEYNVHARITKCSFIQESVEYLGHYIDAKGIHPLKEKGVYRKVESSTWASPMVTVVKESGDLRLCGDYKVTVNQFLEADPYPLPSIEELLSTIGPAKYFSKIDLANAFQQLKLSDGSKELLTVNTPIGLLQYERMPFGIKTAPQIFQRAMDEILNGIKGVVCYIDNILISSTDKERQYQILAEVLKRLEEYNVHARITKCSFIQESVEYLGHYIDAKGIHPLKEKVDALRNLPVPENVPELRAYLGMVNYYGKYIRHLASLTEPLNRLLKKDVEWIWDQECQDAFDQKQISGESCLVPYDPKKPFKAI
ncbi:Transposon Tf2-11 polyprotein [Exaiptasia diaphana]|nr:Transposon Tf2-11 polyprotein [Exaiptasia diaphana]